jgi:hypothetical protein
MGVDVDPSSNTATSLGSIDSCVSVRKGDTFTVDVFVTDVSDLLAWEAYFSFDGDVVNVTDRDVQMFQGANAGSDVWDASDPLPSSGGLYRLGAADIGQPPAPDNGSGVLARLTLKAVRAGISPAMLTTLDVDSDGKIDLGPQLTSSRVEAIGDANGDDFFDGPFFSAQIAVGRECPTERTRTPLATTTLPALSPTEGATPLATVTPPAIPTGSAATASPTPRGTPTPAAGMTSPTPGTTPSAEDEATDWSSPGFIAVYVAIGAVAVLAVGGLALFSSRRRHF